MVKRSLRRERRSRSTIGQLGIAVSPDGTQAAVATASNFAPNALHIIDLATATLAQTHRDWKQLRRCRVTPDGKTLYVGGGADNDVKIFTQKPSTASGVKRPVSRSHRPLQAA